MRAMTVDAMENMPPEDWPRRLGEPAAGRRPGAHLYLTVEEIDDAEIEEAWRSNRERGLPAVRGEVIEGDTAGYHYYPGRDRVLEWVAGEGLDDHRRGHGPGGRLGVLAPSPGVHA